MLLSSTSSFNQSRNASSLSEYGFYLGDCYAPDDRRSSNISNRRLLRNSSGKNASLSRDRISLPFLGYANRPTLATLILRKPYEFLRLAQATSALCTISIPPAAHSAINRSFWTLTVPILPSAYEIFTEGNNLSCGKSKAFSIFVESLQQL